LGNPIIVGENVKDYFSHLVQTHPIKEQQINMVIETNEG
jgi:hypothetical protein